MVRKLLAKARQRLDEAGVPDARLTAEVLLADAVGQNRPWLIAHSDDAVPPPEARRFTETVDRRANREPLQHIRGRQEFFGREFAVSPAVLIPRPETELLIERVLEWLRPGNRVADVGTGSGCVAITLALEANITISSTDISASALAIAEQNRSRHEAGVEFLRADLLTPFADNSLDAVVSNPPYAADREWSTLEPEVRDHEPKGAIVAGETGLEAYERLIPHAVRTLKPGGWLALELGHESLPGVRRLLSGGQWRNPEVFPDLNGHDRMLRIRLRTTPV